MSDTVLVYRREESAACGFGDPRPALVDELALFSRTSECHLRL